MNFTAGETVTVHRFSSSTQDGYGNDVPTWADETVPGVAVWQPSASELLVGQDISVTRLRVVIQGILTMAATDEVTVRGVRRQVDGDPAWFHSPLTGTDVTQVDLVARV